MRFINHQGKKVNSKESLDSISRLVAIRGRQTALNILYNSILANIQTANILGTRPSDVRAIVQACMQNHFESYGMQGEILLKRRVRQIRKSRGRY